MSPQLTSRCLLTPFVHRLSKLLIRSITAAELNESVQEVCTTGYSFMTPSGRVSKYGIFWGPDDPRNTIREVPDVTHVAAMLMAMIHAVRVAHETVKEKELLLYTDYNCPINFQNSLKIYAARDFYSRDGARMKNAQLLEELYKLAKDINVVFRYRPAVRNKKPNYVMENILKGENFKSWNSLLTNIRVGDEMDANGAKPSTSSDEWPVVYTMAMYKSSKTGFSSASYVTIWSDKRWGNDTMHRLAMVPATLFRAQLAGIEDALKQAVDNRLSGVVVVTDSQSFLFNWQRRWLKTNGSFVPNKFLYDRIRDLVHSDIEVRFRYETPQLDSTLWSQAVDKCFESIDLPLVGKDRSEYKRDISEVLVDKSLFDSSTTKVRIFKKRVDMPGGMIWETGKGESEDINRIQGRTHNGLVNILEKATSMGIKHIVVRTDSVRLIQAAENWLPVWHRNGWRNSLHKPIADADCWKKIWWLKKAVKVYWELMDPPSDSDKLAAAQLFCSGDVDKLIL